MKFPDSLRLALPSGVPWGSKAGDHFGAFQLPAHRAPGRRTLNIIASNGRDEEGQDFSGWEHVSVSVYGAPTQTPTWAEMCAVKALFWDDEQCVLQFHPPKSDYVNYHLGTLHMWRPLNVTIPLPPKICV